MKIQTSELTEAALDWAVTMIEKPEACEYGVEDWRGQRRQTVKNGEYVYRWHQSWAQGGPIIEREIDVLERYRLNINTIAWDATAQGDDQCTATGPTPLIAAMRCYVASKLGDEVDVPEELCPLTA
jgi:hypothetical protein